MNKKRTQPITEKDLFLGLSDEEKWSLVYELFITMGYGMRLRSIIQKGCRKRKEKGE
jgi:hypothetical protein